ncbi:uncharacterized protein N7511_001198 [Penicillium nucicola]|uniref:uncharacterized protein n=1 Tax=Penicillium nucicola TaxID=1850975 RepID=UPI002545016F|nr:uncharacterized protein N7511_001198 [Penicillium nucicola]KAJ5776187.1 hypothetical protein N7511_001198 [Penicillium nucicola]
MSRNFVPALLAIGVGVFTGYYTFQPTFQQMQHEKLNGTHQPAGLSDISALKEKSDAPPAQGDATTSTTEK